MYMLLLIIFSNILELTSEQHELNKYVSKYDIVDCYVSGFRSKRNLNMKIDQLKSTFDAEVRFKSHEKYFHLLLIEDIDTKKLKVESYLPDNSTIRETINVKIFEGVLKNEASSFVIGYLHDRVFTGAIKFNETVYFAEPASKFFSNFTATNKIVVYKETDIVFSENFAYNDASDSFWVKFHQFRNNATSWLPKGIKKTRNKNEEYACIMELVADHTLYKYFNGEVGKLTAYLYLHAKYSDFIFRRTDFDGDGKRDRIRIIIEKIFIYKTVDSYEYPMNMASDMSEFLNLFSLRTQNYCLAFCMTYRYSSNYVIGVAFSVQASNSRTPGGICQQPIRTNLFSGVERSFNTAAVTVRGRNRIALPLAISFLAVAHEIGHSFGSGHDFMEDLLCSPGGEKGFYLMHPKSQSDMKPLASYFSPCSKKSIGDFISARGECLKPHPATCGNAVQEGDEDCDCGKETICRFIDHCCTPSDAKPPEKGCTFRKSAGAVCSSKENKCCLEDCSINKDEEFLCYNDSLTCRISYCNGTSEVCPEAKKAPDRYPCDGNAKSCSNGYCNSSVCLDNNLTECVCKEALSQCLICCKKDDHCVTASSLDYFPSSGRNYFALEGTSCNFDKYKCDGAGMCINPYMRKIDSNRYPKSLWFTIAGLTFALLVIVLLLIYFVKQYPIHPIQGSHFVR